MLLLEQKDQIGQMNLTANHAACFSSEIVRSM